MGITKQQLLNTTEQIKTYVDSNQLLDYSLEEQKTGQKWIDGKDIYCRTIDFGIVTTHKFIAHNMDNIDNCIKIEGFLKVNEVNFFAPTTWSELQSGTHTQKSGFALSKKNYCFYAVDLPSQYTCSAIGTFYYTKKEQDE